MFGGLSITPASSFTDLKSNTTTKTFNNDSDESDDEEKTTLSETVAEYEAKRASIHPTTTHIEGDTSTGEENEATKFQVFLFFQRVDVRCSSMNFISDRWKIIYVQ